MTKKSIYITLLFSLLFTFSTAAAKDFISGFEDIPLMEGLKQIESDDISFGNEEVRYQEAQLAAVRKKTFENISKFYQETLPQLGWIKQESTTTSLRFYREAEVLEINKMSISPLKISITLKSRD